MSVRTVSQWYELFQSRQCLFDNPAQHHFVGTSRNHLGGYGCMDPVLCDPLIVWEATGQFATVFGREGELYHPFDWPQAVAAPAVGEVILLQPLATQLIHVLPTEYVGMAIADKQGKSIPTQYKIVRPGHAAQVGGKRVLVVVDFMNTMHTAKQVIKQVRLCGGTVVGVCAMVYNSSVGVNAKALGVPAFYGLTPFTYDVWTPDECKRNGPCSHRVPIVADKPLGHGHELRAEHLEWPADRFVNLLT
jgi:hypothetical protein